MKLFTNILIAFLVLEFVVVFTEEDASFLYKGTRVCARHNKKLCLTFDDESEAVTLSRVHKLKFDIETVERINMQLNRVYTYARDTATRKRVKSCLVKKTLDEYGAVGIGLAPCDTDDKELVLAVETPNIDVKKLTMDEFVLREISYADPSSDSTIPLCLTATHKRDGQLEEANRKRHIKKNSPVILKECDSSNSQEFRARGFDSDESIGIEMPSATSSASKVEAKIGRFCLQEKPELCLGVSLANGTTLENQVFVQVKNYTKNEAKNLHDLKMRWYHNLENQKIASAAELDYCVEGVYGAPIGENRRGTPQYDDIVHLGYCDAARISQSEIQEAIKSLPKSERFYTEAISSPAGSWLEVRTMVPSSVNITSNFMCVSIVKCVRHDFGHCTKYNSVDVYESDLLEQGAYARLKDCNSEEMVSQRFTYTAETEITMPPTKSPTPKPRTATPTAFPTILETTASPSKSPTQPPVDLLPPTSEPDEEGRDNSRTTTASSNVGLKAGLAFVGILCFAVIVAGTAYYYKNRKELQGLPEEDENFIARV